MVHQVDPAETSYYQDAGVTITNARAVLSGKTYAMANITSVGITTQAAKRGWAIFLIVLGVMGVVGHLLDAAHISGASLVGTVLFLVLGIFLYRAAKATYVVRIGSASGEVDGLISKDKVYTQKIVAAMNEAIIKRG